MSDTPSISILTPIFNRTQWLPLMLYNLKNLKYPRQKLEWVILDTYDKKDRQWDKLFPTNKEREEAEKFIGFPIKYSMNHNSYHIGEKRNKLVKLASHKVCANMDSDDIMLATWLEHSISVMKSDPRCSLVGTPEMIFTHTDEDYMLSGIKCGEKRMIHEAGMVFTKKHCRSVGGFSKSSQGEGTGLIDYNENMCLETSADKVIICICHSGNTIDKSRFKEKAINGGKTKLGGAIKDLIQDIIEI
jgi:glycosyltransferase involved in cell wall biosynthesis